MKHFAVSFLLMLIPSWNLTAIEQSVITPEIFCQQIEEASRMADKENPSAELGWIILEITRDGKTTESEFRFYYNNKLPWWERLLHEIVGVISVKYQGNGKPEFSNTIQSIKNSGGKIDLSPLEKARWKESLEVMNVVTKAYVDYYKIDSGFRAWARGDDWYISPRSFPLEVRFPNTWIFFSSERREVLTFSQEFADYLAPLLKGKGFPVISPDAHMKRSMEKSR